jgi:predicted PurR-regulated permease PerM
MDKILIAPRSINQTILLVAGLALCFYLRTILLASFTGIAIGVLIIPVISFFEKKLHLPKAVAALFVLVFILSLVGLIGFGLYFIAADQLGDFFKTAPMLMKNSHEKIHQLSDHYPWMKGQLTKFDLMTPLENSFTHILESFQIGAEAIIGGLFIVALAIYTAIHSDQYFKATIEAFPPRLRPEAKKILSRCAQVLRDWFSAQLIGMVVLGIITALSLWLIGIQYWAVFGLLSTVLCFVPYVGTMIVLAIVSFITLASQPEKILWVILSFFVTHQLEGQVIIPLAMRNKASLPEVPLLIFMLMMGSIGGVLGFFIAPAAFAILKTLYDCLYLPAIERNPIFPQSSENSLVEKKRRPFGLHRNK